jgi:hypothetical protein
MNMYNFLTKVKYILTCVAFTLATVFCMMSMLVFLS